MRVKNKENIFEMFYLSPTKINLHISFTTKNQRFCSSWREKMFF